ncbi:MAG: CDP-glycerol glycerophosphotransferase family protein [Coriobacteriia bacterium]|nr:CDP-glycerol glycerophosphotransferase family protein [Coriobacteriia bacterium]
MAASSTLRKIARAVVKDYVFSHRFPRLYRKAVKNNPVDERKVLFVEGKMGVISDSFVYMMEHIRDNYDYDIEFIALEQTFVGFRAYEANCEALIQKLATAHYVFLNDASDIVSCVPLRPETKVVQLWHACGAFKKWGMSTAELKFGGTKRELQKHPFYRNLSLVTVSSPEVEWAYREAMDLEQQPEVVQPLGVSRTDVFFDEAFLNEARLDVDAAYPGISSKKVILYAPTFRGRVREATGPDAMDLRSMRDAFQDDYVLLIKHHPFVKHPPEIPEDCKQFAFYANQISIDRLMAAADICITDYSSIVFEYSLMNRPIVFFAYDIEDYNDWRGFYYDYDELTPGPVVGTTEELIRTIDGIEETYDYGKLSAFREKFMSGCDGHATQRIFESVFDGYEKHEKAPLVDRMKLVSGEHGCDLSFVIPAHNAGDTVGRAIDSVIAQDYPLDRMEIIVVDDGSDDDTWTVLERYERDYPGVVKPIRLPEPSGSPSKPRNVALDNAIGTYVFCLDADDWLGDEAVPRMLKHALDWDSDLMLVKLRGEGGRDVPKSMFMRFNEVSVDKYRSKVMWSFGPYKLYRRNLVQDIRFPYCMPEDIGFVLRAYVNANRVSVASDYSYYHLTCDSSAGNISEKTWEDTDVNLMAYEDIFSYIAENVPDSERDWTLMRRLFNRDIDASLHTIASEDDDIARAHLTRLQEIVAPFYREDAYRTLPAEKREILDAAFGPEASLERVRAVHATVSETAAS